MHKVVRSMFSLLVIPFIPWRAKCEAYHSLGNPSLYIAIFPSQIGGRRVRLLCCGAFGSQALIKVMPSLSIRCRRATSDLPCFCVNVPTDIQAVSILHIYAFVPHCTACSHLFRRPVLCVYNSLSSFTVCVGLIKTVAPPIVV